MKANLLLHRLVLLLALVTAILLPAAEKGSLGFGLDVKLGGEGSILSFKVAWAAIKSIQPNSPADGHGIAVGDLLIEVDGLVVPGSKGLAFKAKLAVPPGQTVKLKFKRANGDIYDVEIVAGPSPGK